MRDFIEWMLLEGRSDIVFTAWQNDGLVTVVINGKKYRYRIDPALHGRWSYAAKIAPGKILNAILREIRMGRAEQVEPPVNTKPTNNHCVTCGGGEEKCPICGTPAPHYQHGIECPGCGHVGE